MSAEELEAYFQGIELPQQVELVTGVVIMDVPLFIESHFSYIKNNPGLKSADIFLTRLNDLRTILEKK